MAGNRDEIRIVTDAMLAEAAKWARLSDEMDLVKRSVIGLDLAPTAFLVGNTVTSSLASTAYNELQDLMISLLGQAVTEFEQVNVALRKAVDLYEETDGKAAVDLTRIYGG